MENRIYNFNPGPAMQPLEVLQEAQAEFFKILLKVECQL